MYGETAPTLGYADVNSVTREDALFADYYFRAYDAYHGCGHGFVPPAWQIACEDRVWISSPANRIAPPETRPGRARESATQTD